ncbi:penicillin-binding transpeptidase domain-containing protein [Corynebacterium sp. zg-331]|uniref:penicillin-binding transpeptidase domain-containing protein n=1 Tax=unclassified Corynebacterium TaxID=2624378 RepID=UPI00128AFA9D|nr:MULTISPECIES: penicillin-binding transpeptidase domain-containing protein [unclassified Corynebacterium]MBC3185334.1 penicillin-binding transpeptidase domain-containing protein [Corynebacterium sp. zg-331]MPV51831.1 penicillin-binding transpeptidase domain-containing protein [Corynebacterium sp. zg331]
MTRLSALLLALVTASLGLVSCTPKPADVRPVAQDFLTALADRDWDSLAQYLDDPTAAISPIQASVEGLQAEGLRATVEDVDQSEHSATVRYRLEWQLPRQRTLNYEASMLLTRQESDWSVRWQPTIIHPTLGAHQHLELRPVPAERASVVSSDGVALLSPGVVQRLLINADDVSDPGRTARAVEAALKKAGQADPSVTAVSASSLEGTLRSARGEYSVTTLPDAVAGQVSQALAGEPAVRLNAEASLVTPKPNFAPDIMSRVRAIVEDDLDGAAGWRVSVVNEQGSALDDVEYHPATVAPAVGVSIDYDVQRAAEEAVHTRGGDKAMLVAIRPSTGEILAVAQTAPADKDGDIALSGQYPPGSVFKMITATAGFEHQGLSADSLVPCPGTMDIYGRTVTNYNQFSLGIVPLEQAFAQSCNTSFADISTTLEPGQLKETAKQFGLGLDYEIPGLDTITGSVPEGESALDRTESGYGQGLDLASPFGLALSAATAAAGHTPMPTLITGHETTVSEKVDPPAPAAIENLRRAMRSVVTQGTARGMKAQGDIYGKTGEAEINEGSHAWFAGYRDDIAFATLVVLGGGSEASVQITDHFLSTLDKYKNPEPEEGLL